MSNNLQLTDPVFTISETCRVVGVGPVDIDNWMGKIELGVLVPQGGRSLRKFSVEDALVLRVMLALTGPTQAGTRGRTFMSPAAAFLMVQTITPLRNYIALDDDGRLNMPHAPAFMVVRCFAGDDCPTVDVLSGREVAHTLDDVSDQMLVIPLSRLVHEVVKACADIARGKTTTGDAVFTDELKASVIANLRARGVLED